MLLRALEENPACTQRELAGKLGISLGRVNSCLKTLLQCGLTEADICKTAGKKARAVYRVTAKGLAERRSLAGRFLDFKLQEHENLAAEIESLRCKSS